MFASMYVRFVYVYEREREREREKERERRRGWIKEGTGREKGGVHADSDIERQRHTQTDAQRHAQRYT